MNYLYMVFPSPFPRPWARSDRCIMQVQAYLTPWKLWLLHFPSLTIIAILFKPPLYIQCSWLCALPSFLLSLLQHSICSPCTSGDFYHPFMSTFSLSSPSRKVFQRNFFLLFSFSTFRTRPFSFVWVQPVSKHFKTTCLMTHAFFDGILKEQLFQTPEKNALSTNLPNNLTFHLFWRQHVFQCFFLLSLRYCHPQPSVLRMCFGLHSLPSTL